MSPVLERLHPALGALGLTEIDVRLESLPGKRGERGAPLRRFLAELRGAETEARSLRSLQTRLRLAHRPSTKTLAQFDFAFQPSLDERQIRELQTLRLAQEAENVILLGPPGVGSRIWRWGWRSRRSGVGLGRTLSPPMNLVTDLGKAAREGKLERRRRIYLQPKVLVIDAVGYLPLDEGGATLLFQLISARYERGASCSPATRALGVGPALWGAPPGGGDSWTGGYTTHDHQHPRDSYRLKERRKAGLLSTPEPVGRTPTPERGSQS